MGAAVRGSGRSPASGWLFRIINRYSQSLAMGLAGMPSAIEAEVVEQRFAFRAGAKPELPIDIARAIQSLPEHYHEIVVLRDLEELRANHRRNCGASACGAGR
jgi:DNA-directed RNA polymerase specialized sigma24 family protein